ncbi:MAG: hypothetical protein ACPGQO_05405, partial [Candidatus Poseidoniaceae archaeon]
VEWVLWCVEDDDTLHYRSGTVDDWPFQTFSIWEVGTEPTDTVTELESGARYFFGIDGGTNGAGAGGAECGPIFLHQQGISATLSVHIPDGGSTTQTLEIGRFEVGAPVI